MGVKRITVDIDDTPDITSNTSLPPSLLPNRPTQHRPLATTTPDMQPNYDEDAVIETSKTSNQTQELVGRTQWDLVYRFLNQREDQLIVVFMIGFWFSIFLITGNLKKYGDSWFPLLISVITIAAWYLVGAIAKK